MYHDTGIGKGDRPRVSDRAAYAAEHERIFGPAKRVRSGLHVMYRGRLTHVDDIDERERARLCRQDDRPHKSMAMGCADPAEQRRRIAKFDRHGIRGCRYDPETTQLIFPKGLHNQTKLARLHGLDVGRK